MNEPFTLTQAEDWMPYQVRSMLTAGLPTGCAGGRVEGTRFRAPDGTWKLHGEVRMFDANGTLRGRAEYADNLRNGVGEFYYGDGRPSQRATFIKDNIDGTSHSWYPSGVLQCELHWRDRKSVGLQRFYHENGQLSSECRHDDQGRRQGLCVMFRPDGSELARTLYRDGDSLYEMEFRDDQSIQIFAIRLSNGRLRIDDATSEHERVTYYTPLRSPDPLDVVLPEPPPPEE